MLQGDNGTQCGRLYGCAVQLLDRLDPILEGVQRRSDFRAKQDLAPVGGSHELVQVAAHGRQLAVRRAQLAHPVCKEIRTSRNSLADKPTQHTAGG